MTDKKGVSGSTLKLIAVVAMLIDHVAAVFMENSYSYLILRGIGKFAFPVFCFMIVEGFLHTSNKGKYALRLLVLAVISEVPYDLALYGAITFECQNTVFNLLLGMIAVWIIDYLENKGSSHKYLRNGYLKIILEAVITGLILYGAYFMRCDYGWPGVFTIIVMYILRSDKKLQAISGPLTLAVSLDIVEVCSVSAVPFIMMYNGRKGQNVKYLFYIFYPAHLLVLYFIGCFMGIRGWIL